MVNTCRNNICCTFCAEEHHSKDCNKKRSMLCINCIKINDKLNLNLDTGHSSYDTKNCKYYERYYNKIYAKIMNNLYFLTFSVQLKHV